jgi:hypothetical protein
MWSEDVTATEMLHMPTHEREQSDVLPAGLRLVFCTFVLLSGAALVEA